MTDYLKLSQTLSYAADTTEDKETILATAIQTNLYRDIDTNAEKDKKLYYKELNVPIVAKFLSAINELEHVNIPRIMEKIYNIWSFSIALKVHGNFAGALADHHDIVEFISDMKSAEIFSGKSSTDVLIYDIAEAIETIKKSFESTSAL